MCKCPNVMSNGHDSMTCTKCPDGTTCKCPTAVSMAMDQEPMCKKFPEGISNCPPGRMANGSDSSVMCKKCADGTSCKCPTAVGQGDEVIVADRNKATMLLGDAIYVI